MLTKATDGFSGSPTVCHSVVSAEGDARPQRPSTGNLSEWLICASAMTEIAAINVAQRRATNGVTRAGLIMNLRWTTRTKLQI